jgi:hypothetical protein
MIGAGHLILGGRRGGMKKMLMKNVGENVVRGGE